MKHFSLFSTIFLSIMNFIYFKTPLDRELKNTLIDILKFLFLIKKG
jgi:hypothetical protein